MQIISAIPRQGMYSKYTLCLLKQLYRHNFELVYRLYTRYTNRNDEENTYMTIELNTSRKKYIFIFILEKSNEII